MKKFGFGGIGALLALALGHLPETLRFTDDLVEQRDTKRRSRRYQNAPKNIGGRLVYNPRGKDLGKRDSKNATITLVNGPYRGDGPRYDLRAARRRGGISARQQKRRAKAFRREVKHAMETRAKFDQQVKELERLRSQGNAGAGSA